MGPFVLDHAPAWGVPERLAPGLRVVTAPNAGPMTFTGTRSYILGEGEVAVIDPGPDDPGHLDALTAAVAGERVAAVLVTHAHLDHSGGARAFAERVGAELLAHGGRGGPVAEPDVGGGEGIDKGFRPDRRIGEGAVLAGPGWTLTALETPGHASDHLSLAWAEGRALFSGDHVMGWATTLISPPDGDLGAFRASIGRLQARDEAVFYPGHGAPVADPQGVMAYVLAHRAGREAEILDALARGPATVAGLVGAIYAGRDPRLHGAAGRNVLAHLLDLEKRGVVAVEGAPLTGRWELSGVARVRRS